ncbi:phage terminase large subunit family protein, partial [Klebsiella pneumoniae]
DDFTETGPRGGSIPFVELVILPKRSVPDGVIFMTATVDVQGGKSRRFVVQVTGYGEQGERWLVDRYNIRQSLRAN